MLANRWNIWGFFAERCFLPVGDALSGQRMMRRYRFLRKAQWWDAERIGAERDRALQILVGTAYREVPFYQRLFDEAGIRPGDIRTAQDLDKLPCVTKDMFRGDYPLGTSRRTGHRTYEKATSGSTGRNFFVVEDSETAGMYRACFLLALSWAGWRIGEPHFQTGMTLRRGVFKTLKDRVLRCTYASAYDLSDPVLDGYLETIERKRITHVWGYPGSLFQLARRAAVRGWNQPMTSLVTWGDTLDPGSRRVIETAFRCRVLDTFGCAEGIQVAAQCGHGERYHIHALDTVVQVVDDAGAPLPIGKTGNLVLTRLHPGPMPLIRYRVGDRGQLARETCDCGRAFEILEAIRGREPDLITTPSGNRLIVHFFTGVLEHFKEIDCFQVIQTAPDRMTLRVVAAKSIDSQLADRILSALRSKGAQDMFITLETVREIPLHTTGKRRFILQETTPAEEVGAQKVFSKGNRTS